MGKPDAPVTRLSGHNQVIMTRLCGAPVGAGWAGERRRGRLVHLWG